MLGQVALKLSNQGTDWTPGGHLEMQANCSTRRELRDDRLIQTSQRKDKMLCT